MEPEVLLQLSLYKEVVTSLQPVCTTIIALAFFWIEDPSPKDPSYLGQGEKSLIPRNLK